jgi:hypothetical protein
MTNPAPLHQKYFFGTDAEFNGNREVLLSESPGPVVEGAVILRAVCQVDKMEDLLYGFHYLISQNEGDKTNNENFLRFREIGGTVYFEFGSWDGEKNSLVQVPVEEKHIGIGLDIVGVCAGAGKDWVLYINGAEAGREGNAAGALPRENAFWVAGSHHYEDDPRYFQGKIFYAGVYGAAAGTDNFLAVLGQIDADCDNNGYITDVPLNPESAMFEQHLKPNSSKPLTYFDEQYCGSEPVPAAYRRTDLRVLFYAGSVFHEDEDNVLQFQMECVSQDSGNSGMLTIRRKGTDEAVSSEWHNISELYVSSLNPETGEFTDYYYVETSMDSNKPVEPVTVIFRLRYLNGETLSEDNILFPIQEMWTQQDDTKSYTEVYGFNVPSGWGIDKGAKTLRTIVPQAGGIPPMREGSDHTAEDSTEGRNGCAVSVKQYHETGFKLTFTYSFLRNTWDRVSNPGQDPPNNPHKTGYLQPDRNGNRKIDDNDGRKLSFVGNSGIKLGSWKGTGVGVREVAIFDTKAMVDRVKVNKGTGLTIQGLNAFQHDPSTALDTEHYTGVSQESDGKVKFNTDYITDSSNEETLFQLMDGVGYNVQPAQAIIYDYEYAPNAINPAVANPAKWEKLFNTLSNNYSHSQPNNNEIEIYWNPDNNKSGKGTLIVRKKIGGQWKEYYAEKHVPLSGNVSDTLTLDGRIYIQSHWGSGVTFKDIQIGPYVPPANSTETTDASPDGDTAADRSVAKKSGKLLSLLPWLFLLAVVCFGGIYYTGIAEDANQNNEASKETEQAIEKYKSIGWDQYFERRRSVVSEGCYVSGKKVNKNGETYYEFGPVADNCRSTDSSKDAVPASPRKKYHIFNPSAQEFIANAVREFNGIGTFYGPEASVPYVYAEHWTLRKTPPVWPAGAVTGFNKGNFIEAGDEDDKISISLLEKEMERIVLRDGADLSHRVFYTCRIQDYDIYDRDYYKRNCREKQPYTLCNLNCEGSFFDKGDFECVTFKNCSFRRCRFEQSRFARCVFDNCNFEGGSWSSVEFVHSKVVGGNFEKLVWDNCLLTFADFSQTAITLEQVKKTKNYEKRDEPYTYLVIKLPPDIQKPLDEERKQKEQDKKTKVNEEK